jgi:phosphoribosylcarboxyaminoimidazole (NCAIR) mutase
MASAKSSVAVLMGSDSDLPVMQGCVDQLKYFGMPNCADFVGHRTWPGKNSPPKPKTMVSKSSLPPPAR